MYLRLVIILLLYTGTMSTSLYGQCEILLWEDDFSADSINPSNWNIENDNSGGGNDELQYYTPRDTNVYIQDGNLVIQALEEEYQGLSYTSGKLTTKGLADWKYGRMEASIKMPEGKGIWPAFWMLSTENKFGGWPNSGEIDIVELIGQDTNTVYGTLHYGPPWNYTNGIFSLEEGYFSDEFHLFAFEWEPDTMKWFVDNNLYSLKTRDSLNRPEQWDIFHERFYLILNLAIGGNWPGDPDESTLFPQKMEIDYVRVLGDPAIQEIIAVDSAYPNAQNVRYSFTNIPGATFSWSVPSGASIAAGQGTSSILVDWGCMPGEILLNVSDLACTDQDYSLDINFSNLEISGNYQTFPLSENLFTVPNLKETTYSWTFPDDATEISPAGDSILLLWGCSEGNVIVEATNACSSLKDTLYITLLEPRLSGPTTVSENKPGVRYTVDLVPSSNYTWSVPQNAEVTDGQGTDTAFIDFGDEPGVVSVEISNVCYTKTLELEIRITDTVLLADFESSVLEFETWASTTFKIVSNPSPDAVNPSPKVAETFKSEVAWSGIYTDLGYNLDLSKHKKFQLKVLGPKTGQVLLKLEDKDVGTVQFKETKTGYTTANQWQNLEFEFNDAPTDVYDRITLFFDFGRDIENTYYFDDLYLLPAVTSASSHRQKNEGLKLYPVPTSGILNYEIGEEVIERLYLMDIQGRIIMSQEVIENTGSIDLSALQKGIYIIHINSGSRYYKELILIN